MGEEQVFDLEVSQSAVVIHPTEIDTDLSNEQAKFFPYGQEIGVEEKDGSIIFGYFADNYGINDEAFEYKGNADPRSAPVEHFGKYAVGKYNGLLDLHVVFPIDSIKPVTFVPTSEGVRVVNGVEKSYKGKETNFYTAKAPSITRHQYRRNRPEKPILKAV